MLELEAHLVSPSQYVSREDSDNLNAESIMLRLEAQVL